MALTGLEIVNVLGQNPHGIPAATFFLTTTQDIANLGGGEGSAAWGDITGTLSDQTDLQTALNSKTPNAASYAIARNNCMSVTGTSIAGNKDSHANALLLIEPRLQRSRNGGLPGRNSKFIADRFNLDVLSFKPGFALNDSGFNNPASAYSDIIRMIEETRKTGSIALVCATTGYVIVAGNEFLTSEVIALNAQVKAYCNPANGIDGIGATDSGIVYLDNFSVLFNADGTPKIAVASDATIGSTSIGASVINVTDASKFTLGWFVWTSAGSQIGDAVTIIGRNTTANTITIGRVTEGSTIPNGSTIYSHPYSKDGIHPSGAGSMLIANYEKTTINATGLLSNQQCRAPLTTVTAAEQAAGAIENIWGRSGTMEGTVTSGLHEGLLSQLSSPNVSVVTDSNFRGGKAQRVSLPASSPGAKILLTTDTSTNAPITGLGKRLCYCHFKLIATGWQNASAQYNINVLSVSGDGAYPQFPASIVADYPVPFSLNQINFDGTFEIQGYEFLPSDILSVSLEIKNVWDIAAGVTPPTITVGEFLFCDIDDPLLPRRFLPNLRTVTASSSLLFTDERVRFNSASPTTQILAFNTPGTPVAVGQVLELRNAGVGTVTLTATIDGVVNPTLATDAHFALRYVSGTTWESV